MCRAVHAYAVVLCTAQVKWHSSDPISLGHFWGLTSPVMSVTASMGLATRDYCIRIMCASTYLLTASLLCACNSPSVWALSAK